MTKIKENIDSMEFLRDRISKLKSKTIISEELLIYGEDGEIERAKFY